MKRKSSWQWRLSRLLEKLWLRVTLYALLAGLTAVGAVALRDLVPDWIDRRFDPQAIESILGILASSMLAVSTFSLGIMASAIAGASANATPRATQLLLADKTSQQVIASFLGAFVFSLFGIILLKAGIYGGAGRLLLFFVTIWVLVLIFWNFIRWVELLRVFGRFSDLLPRIEDATTEALNERLAAPYFGCRPMLSPPPESALPIYAERPGFVLHIDLAALNDAAEALGAKVWITVSPGGFSHHGDPLAVYEATPQAAQALTAFETTVRQAFSTGDARSFEQDPRFGVIVLAEIASRALSPAVNDPGTAIEVLTRGARILSLWDERAAADVVYPRLYCEPMRISDMFEDFFRPIARDGAGLIEVQVWLQKILLGLVRANDKLFGEAAARQSAEALTRAEATLTLESERQQVGALAAEVAEQARFVRPPTI